MGASVEVGCLAGPIMGASVEVCAWHFWCLFPWLAVVVRVGLLVRAMLQQRRPAVSWIRLPPLPLTHRQVVRGRSFCLSGMSLLRFGLCANIPLRAGANAGKSGLRSVQVKRRGCSVAPALAG